MISKNMVYYHLLIYLNSICPFVFQLNVLNANFKFPKPSCCHRRCQGIIDIDGDTFCATLSHSHTSTILHSHTYSDIAQLLRLVSPRLFFVVEFTLHIHLDTFLQMTFPFHFPPGPIFHSCSYLFKCLWYQTKYSVRGKVFISV